MQGMDGPSRRDFEARLRKPSKCKGGFLSWQSITIPDVTFTSWLASFCRRQQKLGHAAKQRSAPRMILGDGSPNQVFGFWFKNHAQLRPINFEARR